MKLEKFERYCIPVVIIWLAILVILVPLIPSQRVNHQWKVNTTNNSIIIDRIEPLEGSPGVYIYHQGDQAYIVNTDSCFISPYDANYSE